MSLTVVITRDVDDRYRGFLSSLMLEASAGVYLSRSLNSRVRDDIWKVVTDWHMQLRRGSLTMICEDAKADGGLGIRNVGSPERRAIRLDGSLLMLRVDP